MTDEELHNRLIDIATMSEEKKEPAIAALRDDCLVAGMEQTKGSIKASLKALMKHAAGEVAAPVVDDINTEWFIISSGGKPAFCRWEDDGLAMYNKSDFAIMIAPLIHKTQGARPEDVYVQSDKRREYSGTTIDASSGKEVINGKINLWRGFGVEPWEGDCSRFMTYLQSVYPNEWEYILKWSAWVVQNPDKRANVVLFLISREEGTGKSTMGLILRRIFGTRHAVKASRTADLTGTFAAHLAHALFVHGDEITFASQKAGAEQLKTMITDERLRIEAKRVNSFETDNRMSLLMTSNHLHAANIAASDRRYAMCEASPALADDTAFWVDFYRWLDTGGIENIAHLLMNLDLEGFNAERDRPLSELYLLNKRNSLQDVSRWWRDCIDRQSVGVYDNLEDAKKGWYGKKELYGAYRDWHKQQNSSRDAPSDDKMFWRDMRALGAVVDEMRPSKEPRKVKLAPWDEADKQLRAYLLKPTKK